MPRRTHRKSRRGCLECKRRHIKCDESRPRCLNCLTVGRDCSYPDNIQSDEMPALGYEDAAASRCGSALGSHSREASAAPASASGFPSPSVGAEPSADAGASINMHHLELFHHFLNDGGPLLFPVGGSGGYSAATGNAYAAIVDAGLANPYLMHIMLGLASLHLSVVTHDRGRRSFYRHQAAQLQAQALSLFNAAPVAEVTPANAVPMLLFASFLGIQVLGEMLVYRNAAHGIDSTASEADGDTGSTNFSAFLDQFTAYLRLHRGVRAVTGQSWQFLCTSELQPLLRALDAVPRSKEHRGSECEHLDALVREADLSAPSIDACLAAVDHLQWVFDGVRMNSTCNSSDSNGGGISGGGDGSLGASAIHAWPVLLSEDYARLLEQRRPEALVILAYFGVAVHRQRESWFLSDGGRFLVKSVSGYLGPFWWRWLTWPNEVVDGTAFTAGGD